MIELLNKPYSYVIVKNDDDSYSGEIAEFPGCFAQGETITEAMENLLSAAESWIEATIDQGLPIPEPMSIQEFSGRVALRLPKSLHKKAAEQAALDGISLNQFLVDAVAEKVGAVNLYLYLTEQLSKQIAVSTPSIVIESALIPRRETIGTIFDNFFNLVGSGKAQTNTKELINA